LSLNSNDDASSFVATDLENLTVRLLASATGAVAIDLSDVTGLRHSQPVAWQTQKQAPLLI
jgi:hypothetical protein